MFYNKGQPYRRGKVSEQGDLCDWFGFGDTAVVDTCRAFDPSVDERWPEPFCFSHGPSDSAIYLQQRRIIHYLLQTTMPDTLLVEEVTFAILQQALAYTYQNKQPYTSKSSHQPHDDLVHDVKALLASRFRETVTLQEIATAVYSSPYHLSRIFRKTTGFTIHNYLDQLRLRTALGYVAQSDVSLTDLGLELGYSSHSHFTQAFRRTFGTVPSAFRSSANGKRLQEMRKILTA
jgi:AraC-like DNA-binding protein